MSRIVYLNGKYYKESEAKISIFDRGLLFADSVYEVTAVIDNKLIDFPAHIERLENSLNELEIHEMAFLAALPKAPNNYNPINDTIRYVLFISLPLIAFVIFIYF